MFKFEPKAQEGGFVPSSNVQVVRQLSAVLKKLNYNSNISSFIQSSLLNLRLFDEMDIGVFFIDYTNSSFLYVNEPLAGMIGVEKEIILQSDIRILESFIHSNDFPKVMHILRKMSELMLRMDNAEKAECSFKIFFRIKQPKRKYCWVMMSKKVIDDGTSASLINFGTVIRLPEQHAVKRVAGYFNNGKKAVEIIAPNETSGILNALSPRENQILAQVAKGFSSQQISVILELSLQTVKIHRKHILKKLRVTSSIQAIRMLEAENSNNDQKLFTS